MAIGLLEYSCNINKRVYYAVITITNTYHITLPTSLHSLQDPPAYYVVLTRPDLSHLLSIFESGVLCGVTSEPVPIVGLASMPGGVLGASLTLDCDSGVC